MEEFEFKDPDDDNGAEAAGWSIKYRTSYLESQAGNRERKVHIAWVFIFIQPVFTNMLLSVRPHYLSLSKTAAPTRSQLFKWSRLWWPFLIQTTISYILHICLKSLSADTDPSICLSIQISQLFLSIDVYRWPIHRYVFCQFWIGLCQIPLFENTVISQILS